MPELPEVETVVTQLRPSLIAQTINSVQLSKKKLRLPYPIDFEELVSGCIVTNVQRRAKYILITLSNNKTIVIHLGMSGILLCADEPFVAKHSHAFFTLGNQKILTYHDPRRFGLITLIENANINIHPLFKNLGEEPLTSEFNGDFLSKHLANKKQPIKTSIMDAAIVVGVGNIYASESLFMASINPLRPANSLSIEECNKLATAIKKVLQAAIASGGSSLRDYTTPSGASGYFQHKFMVYGRQTNTCYTCHDKIIKIIQAGRSTFFCPTCQG
jgi:formamidopyrimidine-DNA glycosylase